MVGELIMLPLRISLRATRLGLRLAEETAAVAASTVGRVVGLAASRGASGSDTGPAEVANLARRRPDSSDRFEGGSRTGDAQPTTAVRPPERAAARPSPRRETRAAEAPPGAGAKPSVEAEPPPRTQSEPPHVSEEATLVEEFAEPGAEEGAGAEIRIAPPWDDYSEMNARQVIARLGSASQAELAAVQLYESSHRGRQTILNAVQRELRSANGSSSRSQ